MGLAVAHAGGNVTTGAGSIAAPAWTSVAGSDIIVIGHIWGTVGAPVDGDVTDSFGNTYTLLGYLAPTGSTPGIGIWHSNGTTRGASHVVTYNPTAGTTESVNIAVLEITGEDSVDFDATTFATAADSTSPFSPWNVTAAAAISGNQIAVYGVTVDTNTGNFAFTDPTGYTGIISQGDSADLCSYAGYKIDETGTPTVGATRSDSGVLSGRMLLATFKEASAGPANQKVGPTADSVDGAWLNESGSNVNLYASLDETTPVDTDYIVSEQGPANSTVRLKLDPALLDPASSTGHILHWRVGKDVTAGHQIDVTVKLYQGGGDVIGAGTLIATRTHTNVDALTTYDETLTGTEADAITNYPGLYVEFSANQV